MAAAETLLFKAPSCPKKTSFEILFSVNHNQATGRDQENAQYSGQHHHLPLSDEVYDRAWYFSLKGIK